MAVVAVRPLDGSGGGTLRPPRAPNDAHLLIPECRSLAQPSVVRVSQLWCVLRTWRLFVLADNDLLCHPCETGPLRIGLDAF